MLATGGGAPSRSREWPRQLLLRRPSGPTSASLENVVPYKRAWPQEPLDRPRRNRCPSSVMPMLIALDEDPPSPHD